MTVERAASRVLRVFFKLGRFDPKSANPYRQLPYSTIGSVAHRAIARQAAAEATVLLENERNALPMDLKKVTGVAIIGPSADANEDPNETLLNNCGDYSNCNYCQPNHTVTITRGILNHLVAAGSKLNVFTAKGCNHNDTNTSGFAVALAAARNPKVSHVVLAVGLSGTLEGEGNDLLPSRFPIGKLWSGLPGVQMQLVEQIAALGKVTILILVSGGSISLPPNPAIHATLHALYPGVEAGNGIADLLFGSVSPASRLPMSIPKHVSQLPDYLNFSMVAEPYGRSYAWLKGAGSEQAYEYAAGLPYSQFKYHALIIEKAAGGSDDVNIRVSVTNVGLENGWTAPTDEVLLVFAAWDVTGQGFSGRVPVRQLVAFARLRQVAPKETRTWTTTVLAKHYALVNSTGDRVLPAGRVTFFVGGHQPTAASDTAAGTTCLNATLSTAARKSTSSD